MYIIISNRNEFDRQIGQSSYNENIWEILWNLFLTSRTRASSRLAVKVFLKSYGYLGLFRKNNTKKPETMLQTLFLFSLHRNKDDPYAEVSKTNKLDIYNHSFLVKTSRSKSNMAIRFRSALNLSHNFVLHLTESLSYNQ